MGFACGVFCSCRHTRCYERQYFHKSIGRRSHQLRTVHLYADTVGISAIIMFFFGKAKKHIDTERHLVDIGKLSEHPWCISVFTLRRFPYHGSLADHSRKFQYRHHSFYRRGHITRQKNKILVDKTAFGFADLCRFNHGISVGSQCYSHAFVG